jgi:ER membrane protein SH3
VLPSPYPSHPFYSVCVRTNHRFQHFIPGPLNRRLRWCTGLLFTHWIADSLTLWKTPVTDAHLWVAARYYHVLTKGAPGVGYVVAATATVGAVTILWSLRDGEAGNLMFDGGSICEFLFFITLTSLSAFLIPTVPISSV